MSNGSMVATCETVDRGRTNVVTFYSTNECYISAVTVDRLRFMCVKE